MADTIVLGYDGSAGAHAALDQAEWLAKDLGAAVVIAFGYATNPLGGENRDEELAVREMAAALLEEARVRLAAAGVPVTVEIVHDRPAAALVDVAAAHHARLIVVGTNGQGPLMGGILGSVPYRLVHQSPVPVLVVPGGAEDGS
jgi:nucleotide-binding universal stress UspA family protein